MISRLIEMAKGYQEGNNFSAALRLVLKAHDLSTDAAEKGSLFHWAVELEILDGHFTAEVIRLHREALTRKAETVNKVNTVAMLAGEKLSEFIRENGIELKQDGSFTKKYAAKLFDCMSAAVPGDMRFTTTPKSYHSELIGLDISGRYVYLDGNSKTYATWENIAGTGGHALITQRPTDRTADVYLQAEKDLKQAELELRELESKICRLKGICHE